MEHKLIFNLAHKKNNIFKPERAPFRESNPTTMGGVLMD